MKQPFELRFLGTEASPALASAAREKAHKLDQFCADIISCKTSIELMHKHRQQGRQFAVRIEVTMPGHELNITRVDDEDVYVALRDAFDGMKRKIEDAVRQARQRRGGRGDRAGEEESESHPP